MKHKYQIGNYKDTYKNFRLDVPERFNWAYEVFDQWASYPNKLAMLWISPDGISREITFSEFTERSKKVANAFVGLGASPGDRVFTMLPRVVEWWEIILGCIRSLLVPVPGTTLLTTKDISYRINISEATIAITDLENLDKIQSVRADCPTLQHIIVVGSATTELEYENLLSAASSTLENPHNFSSDPLMIYFTSGTTGHPKMVLNTHSSYTIGHIPTGKFWLDNRPTDLHWTLSDTGWAQAAWTAFFAPWNMGASLFIWDQRGRFDPYLTLDMLQKYPITTFFGPTTAYRIMVQENLESFNLNPLRHCVAAGEAVNPEVIETWRNGTGLHIYEGYGQTETTLLAATYPGIEYKPGSMGVVSPTFDCAVVNQDGNELLPGEEGEFAVRIHPERPVGLFQEYWKNPDANSKCFRGKWYYTGDLVTRDQDGYFWFIGRTDDVIISAAYRIGPFEVESALVEHDAVAEAAVIGKPDTMRGEIVKAFVVLSEGYNPSDKLIQDLQDYVKNVTAPYKYPREVEFINELPKTISGKIRRNELRKNS